MKQQDGLVLFRRHSDSIPLDCRLCLINCLLLRPPKTRFAPLTTATIAPFEFAVVFKLIHEGNFGLNLNTLFYLVWSLLEIFMVILDIRVAIRKHWLRALFLSWILFFTGLTFYLITFKGMMLLLNYSETVVGVFFWLVYLFQKDYPRNPLNLLIFILKVIADVLAAIAYFGTGDLTINFLAALLPTLDALFIFLFR